VVIQVQPDIVKKVSGDETSSRFFAQNPEPADEFGEENDFWSKMDPR
jgi:hypothetical protein